MRQRPRKRGYEPPLTGYTRRKQGKERGMKNKMIDREQLIQFRRRLEEEERSGATVEKYLRGVEQFAAFLEGSGGCSGSRRGS